MKNDKEEKSMYIFKIIICLFLTVIFIGNAYFIKDPFYYPYPNENEIPKYVYIYDLLSFIFVILTLKNIYQFKHLKK